MTPPVSTVHDLRPALATGQCWALSLVTAIGADQLDDPTPCHELTVRALVAHLIGGTRRVAAIGHGRPALEVDPHPRGIPDTELARTFAAAIDEAQSAWSDDAALVREVRVPWGTVPGAQALGGYLTEVLVHGWDLAVASGQDPEVMPWLAELGQDQAQLKVPAGARDGIPFDPPVTPAEDARPTERLANWMGRRSRPAGVN